jgi:hypothetical protein
MAPWLFHVFNPSFDVIEIPEYPNEFPPRYEEYIPKFCGDTHLSAQHVAPFFDFVSSLNVVYEDDLMRLFVYSLEGDARFWIKQLCRPREISSLTSLIQAFHKCCDPNYEDKVIEDFFAPRPRRR